MNCTISITLICAKESPVQNSELPYLVFHRLLGTASVPLSNLVRSKNKSQDKDVNLVDGQQNATSVSFTVDVKCQ